MNPLPLPLPPLLLLLLLLVVVVLEVVFFNTPPQVPVRWSYAAPIELDPPSGACSR
jgi:hypothetical protein